MKYIVEFNGCLTEVKTLREGLDFVQNRYLQLKNTHEKSDKYCFISNQFGNPVHHRCYSMDKKGTFIRRKVSDIVERF